MWWLREGSCDVAATVSVSALSLFLRRRSRCGGSAASGVCAVQSWPGPVDCACNAPARTIATSEDAVVSLRGRRASRSRGFSVSSPSELFITALQTLLWHDVLQIASLFLTPN